MGWLGVSPAWSHFTNVDGEDVAKCRKCGSLIRCLKLNTNGMIKHLKNIHGINATFKYAKKSKELKNNKENEETAAGLSVVSPAWSHFTKVYGKEVAKCWKCGTLIRCPKLITNGMVKHLRIMHGINATFKHTGVSKKLKNNKENEKIEAGLSVVSPTWSHFTKVDGEEVGKCRKCGTLIRCPKLNTCHMARHLKKVHHINATIKHARASEELKNKKENGEIAAGLSEVSPAWNHFTKVDGEEVAKCRKCSRLISCPNWVPYGIEKHLKNVHGMADLKNSRKSKETKNSKKNDKKKNSKLLSQTDVKAYLRRNNKLACSFCRSTLDNEVAFGGMYTIGDRLTCHHFCLLLSNELPQNGRDDQGILGFMPLDIKQEVKRAYKLSCVFCHKYGATLKCHEAECKKRFHLPCGRSNGALSLFNEDFESYCVLHRPNQRIPLQIFESRIGESPGSLMINLTPVDYKEQVANNKIVTVATRRLFSSEEYVCGICRESITPMPSSRVFWPPCCKRDRWFHRICVEKLALSAGKHFLKCPLCNNQPIFLGALLKFGFYIPDQDASWEREAGAFSELLERPKSCYVLNCKCPRGRNYNASKWPLLFCNTCGSQAAHKKCIVTKNDVLICSRCQPEDSTVTSDASTSRENCSIRSHPQRLASVTRTTHSKNNNESLVYDDINVESTSNDSDSYIRMLRRKYMIHDNLLSIDVLPIKTESFKFKKRYSYIDSKPSVYRLLKSNVATVKRFLFLETWRSFGMFIENAENVLVSDFNEQHARVINVSCLDLAGVLKNDWQLSSIGNSLYSRINGIDAASIPEQTLSVLNYYANCRNINAKESTLVDKSVCLTQFLERVLKNKVASKLTQDKFNHFDESDVIDLSDGGVVKSNLMLESSMETSSRSDDNLQSLPDNKRHRLSSYTSEEERRNFKLVYDGDSDLVDELLTNDEITNLNCGNSNFANKVDMNESVVIKRKVRNKSKFAVDSYKTDSRGRPTELKIKLDLLQWDKDDKKGMRGVNDERERQRGNRGKRKNRRPAFRMKLKLNLNGLDIKKAPKNKVSDSSLTVNTKVSQPKITSVTINKTPKKDDKPFKNYNLFKYFKVDEVKKGDCRSSVTKQFFKDDGNASVNDISGTRDDLNTSITDWAVDKLNSSHISVIGPPSKKTRKRKRIEEKNLFNSSFSSNNTSFGSISDTSVCTSPRKTVNLVLRGGKLILERNEDIKPDIASKIESVTDENRSNRKENISILSNLLKTVSKKLTYEKHVTDDVDRPSTSKRENNRNSDDDGFSIVESQRTKTSNYKKARLDYKYNGKTFKNRSKETFSSTSKKHKKNTKARHNNVREMKTDDSRNEPDSEHNRKKQDNPYFTDDTVILVSDDDFIPVGNWANK